MARKKRKAACAYCGKLRRVTRDHVPPKNLFQKPWPPDLIAVPCCEACHAHTSADDEYFRAALVVSEKAGDAPGARQALDRFLRSLDRPLRGGLAQRIRRDTELKELFSPGGVFLGRRPVLNLEQPRFDRVAQKIIRGLFYVESQMPVPAEYEVLNVPHLGTVEELRTAVGHIQFPAMRVIGRGEFAYTSQATEEDANTLVWLSIFYDSLPFVGFTNRPQSSG